MRKFKLIIAALLAVLMAITVFQNWEPVVTHLLFVTLVMPQAALLFLIAAIGFTLGVLLTLLSKSKGR